MSRIESSVYSLIVGLAAGMLIALTPHYTPAGDLTWALAAARDIMVGIDPYAHTALGTIPYPLPAAIIVLPLTLLPDDLAASVFFGLSSALLAYGRLRSHGWSGLLLFAAFPYWHAMRTVQWSPLLCAAWTLPWLAPVCFAKPQVGLPILVTQQRPWGTYVLGGVLGLVSVGILPTWPWSWLEQIGSYEFFIPISMLPFGPVLLIAVAHVRNPRARLLLGMAAAPQRGWYDVLPVLLVAQTWRGSLILAVVSWIALIAQTFGKFNGSPTWIVLTCYLPALIYALRTPRLDR